MTFNTLCGSSANEAVKARDTGSGATTFNTLCGSSANEAYPMMSARLSLLATFNTLCGSSANEAMQPSSGPAGRCFSFNTLCGSSANEALKLSKRLSISASFNTLCGSSANEACATRATSRSVQDLSIPSAGRQPMKPCESSPRIEPISLSIPSAGRQPMKRACALRTQQQQQGPFNTLCGSSANEATTSCS